VRGQLPDGVDGVLGLIGTRTLLDSLRMARYAGRVGIAGFLGGGGPIAAFDPLAQLPSGVHLSLFPSRSCSAHRRSGSPRVPFQRVADDAACDLLQRARPTSLTLPTSSPLTA